MKPFNYVQKKKRISRVFKNVTNKMYLQIMYI